MEETPDQNNKIFSASEPVEKKSNKTGIIMTLLAIFAVCGTGFGVYEFMQSRKLQIKNDELANVTKNYELSCSSEGKIEKTDADIANDVNVSENVSDNFLEIPEWGIKIKMPDNLKHISYKIENAEEDERVIDYAKIWAATSSYEEKPDFAEPSKNPNGVFALGRTTQELMDKCTAMLCNKTVVFTSNDYRILTYRPNGFVTQDGSEVPTINILTDIFTNTNNYSEL